MYCLANLQSFQRVMLINRLHLWIKIKFHHVYRYFYVLHKELASAVTG